MSGGDPPPPTSSKPSKPSKSEAKAKRAADDPKRPGLECKAIPGTIVPLVDRGRCEGKKDCVEVCPYGVFDVRRMEDADFAGLGMLAKLKSVAHGRMTAYTPNAGDCQACGLCVVACPEKAIRLVDVAALSKKIRTNPG